MSSPWQVTQPRLHWLILIVPCELCVSFSGTKVVKECFETRSVKYRTGQVQAIGICQFMEVGFPRAIMEYAKSWKLAFRGLSWIGATHCSYCAMEPLVFITTDFGWNYHIRLTSWWFQLLFIQFPLISDRSPHQSQAPCRVCANDKGGNAHTISRPGSVCKHSQINIQLNSELPLLFMTKSGSNGYNWKRLAVYRKPTEGSSSFGSNQRTGGLYLAGSSNV